MIRSKKLRYYNKKMWRALYVCHNSRNTLLDSITGVFGNPPHRPERGLKFAAELYQCLGLKLPTFYAREDR